MYLINGNTVIANKHKCKFMCTYHKSRCLIKNSKSKHSKVKIENTIKK